MLRLSDAERATVLDLLARHAAGVPVWAFGSRVHGRNLKRYSDLDLALLTQEPLSLDALAELRDAFAESDLPFRVDLVDWAATPESFRAIIGREHEIVVQP